MFYSVGVEVNHHHPMVLFIICLEMKRPFQPDLVSVSTPTHTYTNHSTSQTIHMDVDTASDATCHSVADRWTVTPTTKPRQYP